MNGIQFRCSNCRYLDDRYKYCHIRTGYYPEVQDVCQLFRCRDGKRPRFFKFAGNLNEMANAVVCERMDDFDVVHWFVNGKETEPYNYDTKEKAIEAAKEWLMEEVANG